MKIDLDLRFSDASGWKTETYTSDVQPSVGDHIASNTGILHVVVKRVFVYDSEHQLKCLELHLEATP
jgi:hypothetical protein